MISTKCLEIFVLIGILCRWNTHCLEVGKHVSGRLVTCEATSLAEIDTDAYCI